MRRIWKISIFIENIRKFNQREDNKIVKALCKTEDEMNSLISNGLYLDYINFRVEKYQQQVKPLQCFNCQKFGHFSSSCGQKSPICVKCGGKHKLAECKGTEAKCANCNGNHTSSYGGCKVFQKFQKEKVEIIKKKAEKVNIGRLYSQVVNSNAPKNELSHIKKSIQQITKSIQKLSGSISQSVSKQLNEFETNQDRKIQNLINSFFTKQESFIYYKSTSRNGSQIQRRIEK